MNASAKAQLRKTNFNDANIDLSQLIFLTLSLSYRDQHWHACNHEKLHTFCRLFSLYHLLWLQFFWMFCCYCDWFYERMSHLRPNKSDFIAISWLSHPLCAFTKPTTNYDFHKITITEGDSTKWMAERIRDNIQQLSAEVDDDEIKFNFIVSFILRNFSLVCFTLNVMRQPDSTALTLALSGSFFLSVIQRQKKFYISI